MDPLELRRKRAALIGEMRAMLDKAETEKRDLSGEEEGSYKKMEEDVRKLGDDIQREESLRSLEDGLEKSLNEPHKPSVAEGRGGDKNPRATEEYRRAFWAAMTSSDSGAAEYRDLFKASDIKGGYLVPEAYETELIKALANINVMRSLATVRTVGTLSKIPIVTGRPTFSWVDEKGAYQETDTDFGQVVIDAYKGGGIVKVSEELLEDSFLNLEAELREQFALAQGDLEEAAFVNGNGDNKPWGVAVKASLGVTAAATAAIAADELMGLKYSLRAPYRPRAKWLMKDATALMVAKLKDGNGQYMWQPAIQAGQPDVLLGSPVVTSEFMPSATTGNRSVLYGDFSYYRIYDRAGVAIQRLSELYAANGQIGFRITFRTDGTLVLAEAVKALQQA